MKELTLSVTTAHLIGAYFLCVVLCVVLTIDPLRKVEARIWIGRSFLWPLDLFVGIVVAFFNILRGR